MSDLFNFFQDLAEKVFTFDNSRMEDRRILKGLTNRLATVEEGIDEMELAAASDMGWTSPRGCCTSRAL